MNFGGYNTCHTCGLQWTDIDVFGRNFAEKVSNQNALFSRLTLPVLLHHLAKQESVGSLLLTTASVLLTLLKGCH